MIKKSAEDYLEAMLVLNKEHGYIRSVDIANYLGVTKPSVSYATKHLREDGYIRMAPDGLISLTEPGLRIALQVYERHETLAELFIGLGVDPEIAHRDACLIEHDVSEETFSALRKHADEYILKHD
jgi:Mn-dependent DtxR family transcriptional regulator